MAKNNLDDVMKDLSAGRKTALVLNVFVAVFGIIGVFSGMTEHANGIFAYYAIDAGLFAFIGSLIYLVVAMPGMGFDGEISPAIQTLRFMTTSCQLLAFAAALVFLLPRAAGGFSGVFVQGSGLFTQLLGPACGVVSFVFFEEGKFFTWKDAVIALIPTVIYVAATMVLSASGKLKGPYPFNDGGNAPVWALVFLALGLVLALVLVKLNERFARS